MVNPLTVNRYFDWLLQLLKMRSADENTDCRWTSDHWWSNLYELRCGNQVVASVRVKGSSGLAELQSRVYTLKRFRLPPYVTLRNPETDDLVARVSLIPNRGLLAEFNDGESFRLGSVNWFKREWAWTNEGGETVLLSRHTWWGRNVDVRTGPGHGVEGKWALLAVLELAVAKLAFPWS